MKLCVPNSTGRAAPLSCHRCLASRPGPLHPRGLHRQPVCLPSGSRVPCRPCAAAKQAAPRNPRARKKPAGEQRDGSQNGGAENGAADASSAAAGAEDASGAEEEAKMDDAQLDEELAKLLETHTPEEIMEQMKEAGLVPDETVEEFPVTAGREPGYTPFEYITFTDEEIMHSLCIQVDAPLAKVYRIWANRINYNEWFDLIGQVILHTEDPDYASYFLFYRWGRLPTLELYSTLRRTAHENESIIEQSVDGMDLAAAAYFREKDGGTEVALRVAYMLPEQLREYVGPVGVWGDVNDILEENMAAMKAFVEAVDLEELEASRREDQERMDADLAVQNEQLAQINDELDEEGVPSGEGSPVARKEMARLWKEMGLGGEEEEQQQPEQAAERAESAESAGGYDADEPEEAGALSGGEETDGDEPSSSGTGTRRRRAITSVSAQQLRDYIAAGKTMVEAAKELGMNRTTLMRRVEEFGLDWPKSRGGGTKGPGTRGGTGARAAVGAQQERQQPAQTSVTETWASDSDDEEAGGAPGRTGKRRPSKRAGITAEQIVAVIEDGKSQADASKILGLSVQSLRKRSQELGIQWPAKPTRAQEAAPGRQ